MAIYISIYLPIYLYVCVVAMYVYVLSRPLCQHRTLTPHTAYMYIDVNVSAWLYIDIHAFSYVYMICLTRPLCRRFGLRPYFPCWLRRGHPPRRGRWHAPSSRHLQALLLLSGSLVCSFVGLLSCVCACDLYFVLQECDSNDYDLGDGGGKSDCEDLCFAKAIALTSEGSSVSQV